MNDIEAAGTAIVVVPMVATSIRQPVTVMNKLKKKSAERGIGYQTLLKNIVAKHIDEE